MKKKKLISILFGGNVKEWKFPSKEGGTFRFLSGQFQFEKFLSFTGSVLSAGFAFVVCAGYGCILLLQPWSWDGAFKQRENIALVKSNVQPL
jgi:hypothetical protein